MKTLRALSVVVGSALVLTGCATPVAFFTDGGCGEIRPEESYPDLFIENAVSFDAVRATTDLEWTVTQLPEGQSAASVHTGAVTTLPVSEFLRDVNNSEVFNVQSLPEDTSEHIFLDLYATVEEAVIDGSGYYSSDDYTLASNGLVVETFMSDNLLPSGELSTLIYHMPATILASCDENFIPELNERITEVRDNDYFEGDPLNFTDTSATSIYPGYEQNAIEYLSQGTQIRIASDEPGWVPMQVAVAPWFEFSEDSEDAPQFNFDNYSEMEQNWLALLFLVESGLASEGLGTLPGESEPDPNLSDPVRPLVWTNSPDGEYTSPGATFNESDNSLTIDVGQEFTLDLIKSRLEEMMGGPDNNILNLESFSHLVLYTALVKDLGNGGFQMRYSFNRLDFSDPEFQTEQLESESLYEGISQQLGSEDMIQNLKINGLDEEEFLSLDPAQQGFGQSVGVFSGASGLTDLESGLLMVPGYEVSSFSTEGGLFAPDLEIVGGRNSSKYVGNPQSVTFDDLVYPDSVIGALARSIDQDPSVPLGENQSTKPLYDPLSLSFELSPEADYLKLDFVLAMTEFGTFNRETEAWSGYISEYPDGLGMFVKSADQSWLEAVNCAAVPTTGSYLSMFSGGVLPPGDLSEVRALAAENYLQLVSQTLEPDYSPNPNRFVDRALTEPQGDLIPPPMVAYSVSDLGSVVSFVTTPMTCVVDVSEIVAEGQSVEVGLAIANLYDEVFPPGFFISASSIRFADNPIALQQEQEEQLLSSGSVAAYEGPVVTSKPVTTSAGDSVALLGSKLDSVTSVLVGGLEAKIVTSSAGALTFELPLGLALGKHDMTLVSPYGRLQLQGFVNLAQLASMHSGVQNVVKRDGEKVRVLLTDVVGAGKVQLFFNGREIAWVRAVSHNDPKLRIANESAYLVRTLKLRPGQNSIEIFVNGERLRKVSFTQ